MYLTLGDMVLVLLFGGLCLYFLSAIRVRELAVQAVAQAGRRDDYQLLDQTVHIRRISLSRDQRGRWRVWRPACWSTATAAALWTTTTCRSS